MNRSLQWDIFCKVIDNFGDIGVAWRLAADLAARGQQVRLWVDDASALAWMAPAGCEGVRVRPWAEPLDLAGAEFEQQPPEVMIEAFGCKIAPDFIAACARIQRAGGTKPVWINLEYLSAEPYVERCHALPSPVQGGPASGWTKWFFYPGFIAATGGLLREPDLAGRQARFDRGAWLATRGIPWRGEESGEKLVSLFCYEPPALAGLLRQWALQGLAGQPVHLLVAAGRAETVVKAVFNSEIGHRPNKDGCKQLLISYLPLLTQRDYDHLLWACDLNFVRGEDSVARALWAGKPFVWQIYPQHDDVHLAKLHAFLDWLEAPASLRAFHAAWNQGAARQTHRNGPMPGPQELPGWQSCALAARSRLMAQDDLGTQLLRFVAKKTLK
ncbi:MAG: elongation factor P maturation arginine rhamnosyltransferase EarP [Polaromonas sp.]